MIRVRAVAAVGMLVGFFVLVLALLGALVAYGVWGLTHGRVVHGAVALAGILVVILGVGQVLVAPRPSPTGLRLTRERAPSLWQVVEDAARRVGSPVPDEIRLVVAPEIRVSEESRMLGLVGGWSTVWIGMPLLGALSIPQVRAALVRELGMRTHRSSRSAAIAHRGGEVVAGMALVVRSAVMRVLFQVYARLYLAVAGSLERELAREASAAAATVAGSDVVTGMEAQSVAVADQWGAYRGEYMAPMGERGYIPTDVFDGFTRYRAARGGQAPYEPASLLVADLPGVVEQLEAGAFRQIGYKLLPWTELTAKAGANEAQLMANRLLWGAARMAGTRDADLRTVLALLTAGRQQDLERVLAEEGVTLHDTMEAAIAASMVDAGAARWRHSWTGPAELVDGAEQPVPLDRLAALGLDPGSVHRLEYLARPSPG